MKNKIIAIILLISISLSSCNIIFNEPLLNESPSSIMEQNDIADRMRVLQNFGYFPTVVSNTRSITDNYDYSFLTPEEIEKMNMIANNPIEALQEISNDFDGEAQLILIATMLSEEATVGDVFEAMYNVDPEMASEYITALEEQGELLLSSSLLEEQVELFGRTLTAHRIKNDIFSIKLKQLPSQSTTTARGILSNDLNNDTIAWYMGYCAVATAGMITYKFAPLFKPWLKVIGLGVAAGGFALMGTQLVKWYSNNGAIQEFITILRIANECFNIMKDIFEPMQALERVNEYLNRNRHLLSPATMELFRGLAREFYGPFADIWRYFERVFSDRVFSEFIQKILLISTVTTIPCVLAFNSFSAPVISIWNRIVNVILGAIPGVQIILTIFIPIRPI